MATSIAVLTSLVLAQAAPVQSWSLGEGVIGFDVKHSLHAVHGESREIEARAVLGSDGVARMMARVPVRSFRSGDANRDAHMLEVLEAERFPFVVLKAKAPLTARASFPATVEVVADALIDFHGQERTLKVPLTLEFLSASEVRVRASFEVSLEAFDIERPSLFFVKIDDACRIGVDLTMKPTG